jgi:hypothetical protein
MEPRNDEKLSEVLKEWEVAGAPRSLDRRVLALRGSWWRFLLTGSIRLPVPVGLALVAIVLAMGLALLRKPAPNLADSPVNLVDFQPIGDPQVRVLKERP